MPAPSSLMPDVPQEESPTSAPLPVDKIEALFSVCRARVNEQIHSVQNLSEKEIMAIGESVKNIVNHTRQYIEESKDVVVRSFAGQSSSLTEFLSSTKQTTEVQNNTVKEALTLSDDITQAGMAVDKLANQARLLALNAKIEAARLGSAGSAFSVITEEMNHLSMEIAKTNRLIADSTHAIRACLPMLAEQATTQMKRLEKFSWTLQGYKEGIEKSISSANDSSDSHINQILNLAYDTLSHLQFQDPMIQGVQKIDHLVKELHDELNRVVGISEGPGGAHLPNATPADEKVAEHRNDSGEGPDAGEVLLF
jgi:methyl-accepting chemotaxis protein